ncbi:HNH endonuclease signature motif containing protein [Arthrobacter pascens]|uniref:HNH endonuclease signature motif containing protein n=1 Tax=Arthrobacter pascens TaxID=1677 RepID=UPI0027D9281C|nr:HNH endonuclease signature motif containing protein [Arthrobacter pascens]
MESRAAKESLEAFGATFAALAVLVRRATDSSGSAGTDPLRDQADACLDGLGAVARAEAQLAGLKVLLARGFEQATQAVAPPPASPQEHTAREMAVVAEVACVLTVSERSASALLAQSRELTTTLPRTLAALQDGSISWQHARVMVDETTSLDPAGAAALEAHFLDPEKLGGARSCPAGELVPSRFRAKARTWRERHHPVSIEKRHSKGILDRRVEYAPDRDGMAWLSAYLPADTAAGIWDRTTTAARALQGPDEGRTLTQLRADTVAAWLLEDTGTGTGNTATITGSTTATTGAMAAGTTTTGGVPSPKAQVLITVPVFALMGLTDEPATLDGYGPIPASMARRLVADGADSFHRVLTDPRDGAPLEIGRTSYRIPTAMRQWLRMRDGKCPFPGCNNHSLDNEADHLLAWHKGGTTGISNLGQPCRKHHKLRHTTAWKPTQATKNKPPGWTSPTGRHYQSEQQNWEPPHCPQQVLASATRPALVEQSEH